MNVQKITNFFSWCWVAFFGFMGIGLILDSTTSSLGGLIVLAAAVLMAPPIKNKITIKSLWLSLVAGLMATIAIGASIPKQTPERQKAQQDKKEQTERQAIADTEDGLLAQEQLEQEKQTEAKRKTEDQLRQQVEQQRQAEASAEHLAVAAMTTQVAIQTNYDVSCKVVGISDGDTMTCLTDDKRQVKIRFDQIDAPETGQGFGGASKRALSDMIHGKTVNLDTKEQDKYGRTVAEVYYDGKNVNKEMVALGMAWAYREYVKDQEYLDLENAARRASLGIWSEPNPIYPSDYRRAKRGEQKAPVQTQQIQQSVEKAALVSSKGQCGSKRYCKEMTSCKEAKHYLNVCGVHRLDRDGDGIPCESLCK